MSYMRLNEQYIFDIVGDIPSGLTDMEINYLRNLYETRKDLVMKAQVGGASRHSIGEERPEVRTSELIFMDHLPPQEIKWLEQKLINLINFVNDSFYRFDIQYLETIQLTKYDESYKGFYTSHMDTDSKLDHTCRKLSFIIQLSDLDEFEGGDFYYHNTNSTSQNPSFFKKGNAIFFPSCMLHEVKPVTKGTRYTLVGWVGGPRWK
jgi:PKHD-type hydroxylase